MQYSLLKQIVQSIISSIQNTGVASVRALTKTITQHTYPVKVTNPVTKVDVKGKVEVTNQKDISPQIKAVEEAVKSIDIPKEVKVSNFPKFPEFPKFPNKIEVSNMTKEADFSSVVKNLMQLQKAIEKLKLDPTIKVDAPIIPPAQVHVEKTPSPTVNVEAPDLSEFKKIMEFLTSLDAKNPLAVRLSDGQKFYKSLEKMADIYAGSNFSAFQDVSGGEGRAILNRNNEVQVTIADTWDGNDVEKASSTLTYAGEESVDGRWRVRKITKSGNITSIRHATIRNNPTYEIYADAWTDRASLDYGFAKDAL